MKICPSPSLCAAMFAVSLSGTSAFAQEPAELTEKRNGFIALEKDLDRPIHQFNELYRQQLEAVEKKATEDANLELIIAIRKERETFIHGVSAPSAHPELERIQKIYAAKCAELKEERRKVYLELLRGYHTNLTELQAEMTKANRIDEALFVLSEAKSVLAKAANLPQPGVVAQQPPAPATPPPPAAHGPSTPLPAADGGDAGAAFTRGGTVSVDTVLPVQQYVLRDIVRVGNREEKVAARLTVLPGTVIDGKKIYVDSNSIAANGAKFKDIEIQLNLNAQIHFESCLLQDCNFTKGGGWWVDAWSAQFTFKDCAFSKGFFSRINTTDHGFDVTNCSFYDVEFAQISYKRDAATESASEWRTIENCRFVGCKIPESFLLATTNCVFEDCRFIAEKIDGLSSPVEVTIYYGGDEPKLPDANPQITYKLEPASKHPGSAGAAYPHEYRLRQLHFAN